MKKNKFIKTGLYFILSVLLLTSVCVVVYTAGRDDGSVGTQALEPQREQTAAAEEGMTQLQQVSSTAHPKTPAVKPQDTGGSKQAEASAPVQTTTFQLTVTDGCLQVCIAQTGVLYMETDIEYDLLPENVQQQIAGGKYFESEEALLEFLENYSS